MWGLSWKPLSLKNNIDFRLGRHVEEDLVTTCRFGLSVWIGQILWSSALAVNLACFIPTTCLTVWIGWFGFSIIFGKIKRGKFQELTKETNYFTLYRRDLGVYGVSTIQCRLGNGYGCVAWRRWQTWTGLRRWQKKKWFCWWHINFCHHIHSRKPVFGRTCGVFFRVTLNKGPIGGTHAQSKQRKFFLFGWMVDAATLQAAKPDANTHLFGCPGNSR